MYREVTGLTHVMIMENKMKILKKNYFLQLSLALVMCAAFVSQTQAAPTAVFTGGATSVTLDEGLTTALDTLGVTVGVSDPGTIDDDGVISFPIVAGALDSETSIGDISHSGGLTFSSEDGTIVVDLLSFMIDNTSGISDVEIVLPGVPQGPKMTGLAGLNDDLAGRFALFNMDLTDAIADVSETDVTITGVGLTLTAVGAAALNQAFAVDAFTPGFVIGTADVAGTIQEDDDSTDDGDDSSDDSSDGA